MQLIDETETDLRNLIERDFGRLAGGHLTSRQILDWMHYRARLIPCRTRSVVVSQEVEAQMPGYPAIGRLKTEFESGRDVSPWLSDLVRKRKEDPLADLMFNDWQISHFHLGKLFVTPNKVGPRPKGELLLFALVKANHVTSLDLHPHGVWTTTQLLRVLLRTSPQDMPEAKGIIDAQTGGPTDADLLKVRQAGYTAPIHLDGKVFFPPGLGVSGSRHAVRLVLQFNRLSREIRNLHRRFTANDLPHQLPRQLSVIGILARLGISLREDGCMVLFEKTRAIELLVMPPLE
jgi:hypothetical protein